MAEPTTGGPSLVAVRLVPEREYIVLEEWIAYVEVVMTAPNKRVAIERAKEALRDSSGGDPVLLEGQPTGRYEARRA